MIQNHSIGPTLSRSAVLCSQFSPPSLLEADSGVFLGETVNTSKGEDGRGEEKENASKTGPIREHFFLGNNDGKYINLWYYDDFCDSKWSFLMPCETWSRGNSFWEKLTTCVRIFSAGGEELTWLDTKAALRPRIRPQNCWIVRFISLLYLQQSFRMKHYSIGCLT